MPRKRGVRARPLEAQHDTSVTLSPTTECPSSASFLPAYEDAALQTTPPSEASVAKCSPEGEEPATGLTGDRPCVSILSTSMESTDAPELNDSTSVFASQEDACAFHSPRSVPGDAAEDMPEIKRPLEEGMMPMALVDTPELVQPVPSRRCEADASVPSSTPSSPHELLVSPLELQHIQQQPQVQTEQEQQHEQKQQVHQQQASVADNGAIATRTSPVSESEGEWIRIEEPCRNNADAAFGGLPSSCPEELYTSEREPRPVVSPVPPSAALPPQSVMIPICIGNATQAEVGTGIDSSGVGLLPEILAAKASERDWETAGFSPPISPTDRSADASPKGFLSCISRYAMSLAFLTSGRGRGQQERQGSATGLADEVNALPSQAKSSPRDKGRLLQSIREWHQRFLEMYGGPVEDITRLALQVLPAQATDDQSERRLLIIQGLFDVFCLYRAYFLSPSEGLLQAETLHQQWRLRAERSLGRSGGPNYSGPPLSFDGHSLGERPEGLPLSVRLALYGVASLALKIVRSLQLLLEINKLRKEGVGSQFALCLRLELLKLVLKMILYALTPFAFYCDEQSIAQALEANKEKQMAAEADRLRPCYGKRTGRRIPPLPSAVPQTNDEQAAMVAAALQPLPRQWALLVALWILRELRANMSWRRVCDLGKLLKSTSWRPVLGEVLYHIRPFVHLYLLKRARTTKSWTPWLAALFIEANSVSLLHGSPQVMERLSPIEAAELRRRMTGVPYALLRPPFFDKFLARPFETIDFFLRRVPLLNYFNVLDAFLVYRNLYFTTSIT